jgi:hypothetical protein
MGKNQEIEEIVRIYTRVNKKACFRAGLDKF